MHTRTRETKKQTILIIRAVPLAPLFAPTPSPTPTTTTNDNNDGKREGVCPEEEKPVQQTTSVPPAVLQEFQQALEACTKTAHGAAAAEGGAPGMTLKLLDQLLEDGKLNRLPAMFSVGGGGGGGGGGVIGDDATAAAKAASSATQLDEEVEEMLLFARIPDEEEWSRCVCVCVCARCSMFFRRGSCLVYECVRVCLCVCVRARCSLFT